MGWIEGLSNEKYHSSGRLGSGKIKDLARMTGTKYDKKYNGQDEQERKYVFDRGSILHMAVLEPHLFESMENIAILPDKKRPTSAQLKAAKPSHASIELMEFWVMWDMQNNHKYHIKQSDYDNVLDIVVSLKDNPIASRLLFKEPGMNEVTGNFKMGNTECQIRCDRLLDNGDIVDLKGTALEATVPELKRKAFGKGYGYGYQVQGAYYLDGADKVDETPLPHRNFYWVVVEWEAPFDVAIFRLGKRMREEGRLEYINGLYNLAKYEEKGYTGHPIVIQEIERDEV